MSVRARLRAGQTEKFRFDSRQGRFPPRRVQIDFRPFSSSYSVGTGGLFLGQSGIGLKQTTQFHTVWNLGMGGAVPPRIHVTYTGILPLLFTRFS